MEEKEKNLIELKHKVLSQRIDRLYNIFIVLSQDGEHAGNLRAIEVIKEQYEKMYKAIIEREEFEKYEEVENTIISKISKIEAELDKYIYRTAKNCKQILKDYLFRIYKYDDINLDEKLDKIKAIKELLKLYMPYINSEIKLEIQEFISDVKYSILKRKEISGMTEHNNAGIGSLLSHCDSEEEKERFKELAGGNIFVHKNCDYVLLVLENEDEMCDLLRRIIIDEIARIKQRIDDIYHIMKILHIVEKINGRIDITKDVEEIECIQEKYSQLHNAVCQGQYNKYLEIKTMIPAINEADEKLNDYVSNSPNGMEYILDAVTSDEYMRQALLMENEEHFDNTLEKLMKMYQFHHGVSQNQHLKYTEARQRWRNRESIRHEIKSNWPNLQVCDEEKTALRPLLDFPIFDSKVLNFNYEEHTDEEKDKFKYFRSLVDKKYSVNDWYALRTLDSLLYSSNRRNYGFEEHLMDYPQKLVWRLYSVLSDRTPKNGVYYLIELDSEYEFCTNYTKSHWPVVEGTELYILPDFNEKYDYDKPRLDYLYVRTKKLIIKTHELKKPLDESKMKKISQEEAEQFISRVRKGEYESNINKIVDDIFALWPETEENRERRNGLKEEIKGNIKKWNAIGYYPFEKVKCRELYIAIKKEVNRIRLTSKGHKCTELDDKKIKHLTSFVDTFLKKEIDLILINGREFKPSER